MKNSLIYFALLGFLLCSCIDEGFDPVNGENPLNPPSTDTIPPDDPIYQSSVPLFSILTYHLIWREYDLLSINGSPTWHDYLEARLIELYPENAYVGMVQEDLNNFSIFLADFELYTQDWIDYELAIGTPLDSISDTTDNLHSFVSLADEISYLDMSGQEVLKRNYYDSLVLNDTITRSRLDSLVDDLDSAVWKKKASKGKIAAYVALGAVSPKTLFRVIVAEQRTYQKTDYYYNQGKNGAVGEKSDAFKHIFVSMQLRNYCGRVWATIIMSGYEKIEKNGTAHERQMDLHNNKIGRHTKYSHFNLGTSWNTWANRTRTWINATHSSGTSKNGIDVDWENSTPNKSTCKDERASIGSKTYIYYY
ncbi:MAG: DUF6973 domain-containing protein [Bacteroidia bacterium]